MMMIISNHLKVVLRKRLILRNEVPAIKKVITLFNILIAFEVLELKLQNLLNCHFYFECNLKSKSNMNPTLILIANKKEGL
jgi:hypothetical protein